MSNTGQGIPPFPTIQSQDEIDRKGRARARSNTARARLGRALAAMRLPPVFGGQTAASNEPDQGPVPAADTQDTDRAETWPDDFRLTLDDLILETEEEAEPVRFPYKG